MTEFPVERRDLLRTTGAGVLGATGLSRASGRQDTSGGDLIWTFTPDVFGATVTGPSSPTVIDDAVYVGSLLSGDTDTATAHAVDTASGEQVETFDALSSSVNNCIHSSPAVVDGWVYLCGGRGNSVHRFDASDGTNDWSVDIGGNLFASPTVTGKTVFVHRRGSGGIDASESVHALAADSGEELWTFETLFGWTGITPRHRQSSMARCLSAPTMERCTRSTQSRATRSGTPVFRLQRFTRHRRNRLCWDWDSQRRRERCVRVRRGVGRYSLAVRDRPPHLVVAHSC